MRVAKEEQPVSPASPGCFSPSGDRSTPSLRKSSHMFVVRALVNLYSNVRCHDVSAATAAECGAGCRADLHRRQSREGRRHCAAFMGGRDEGGTANAHRASRRVDFHESSPA